MKVDILDYQVFASLLPQEIEKYLDATGWHQIRREEETVGIWERVTSNERYRLWLPLDIRLSDFDVAMGRAVKTIALAENRSQLQILEDFDTVVLGDVIRTGTWDELNRDSSTIPLSAGEILIRQSYELARSAALSTVEKRPTYSGPGTAQVQEYMQTLRLGQSERGSYLIKLISPLYKKEHVTQDQGELPEMPPANEAIPFERQVVINLLRGLDALQRVALETEKRGRFYFQPFDELVVEGVSANLCEAVIGDDEELEIQRPLEVSVTWSYALKPPEYNRTQSVSFKKGIMPYISQAAEKFRESHPERTTIKGYCIAQHEVGQIGKKLIYNFGLLFNTLACMHAPIVCARGSGAL